MVAINGEVEPGFEAVREAFVRNFEEHGEVGAGVAVYLKGRQVVELWGGHADEARTREWDRETIVNVFSTTKGMTTICAHRLIEEGKLDVDAPVAEYWPEFAASGKQAITVRQLLSHQAGMAAIRRPLSQEEMFDWPTVTAAMAEWEPWWEPGTTHGYHALTFGWLIGELVRRISGRSLGTYFRENLAEPLGLDCHIGTGPEHDGRIADLIAARSVPGQPSLQDLFRTNPDSLTALAFGNPPPVGNLAEGANTRAWRAAEIPAVNGHMRATALARLYGALAHGGDVDGVHVLSPQTLLAATLEQSNGPDRVLGVPTRFGLGFMLNGPFMPVGPNPNAFGHPGMGGSLGYADPDAGIGFGYVMNQMRAGLSSDPRSAALIESVYSSL